MVGVFVLCINCFGIVYMVRYEVLGADNQEMELKRSRSSQNWYCRIHENRTGYDGWKTVTLLTDPTDLAAGKEIFTTNCAACHRADGGGMDQI
jgi:cytochrome c oxidase cbb3-type subunit 3